MYVQNRGTTTNTKSNACQHRKESSASACGWGLRTHPRATDHGTSAVSADKNAGGIAAPERQALRIKRECTCNRTVTRTAERLIVRLRSLDSIVSEQQRQRTALTFFVDKIKCRKQARDHVPNHGLADGVRNAVQELLFQAYGARVVRCEH